MHEYSLVASEYPRSIRRSVDGLSPHTCVRMIHRPPRKLGWIAQTDGAGDKVHLVQRLPGLLQRPMALKVQGEVEVDASLVAGSRGGRGVASTRYPPDRRDPSLKQGKKIVRWVKKKGCIPSFDLYSLELMRDPKRKGNRPSSSAPPHPGGRPPPQSTNDRPPLRDDWHRTPRSSHRHRPQ